MKVKHFSHIDADGAGSVIVSNIVFDEVDYELCDYGNINERVSTFIMQLYKNPKHGYDLVALTDISVTLQTAQLITRACKDFPLVKFVLVDHHDRVLWLNEYKWATIKKEKMVNGKMIKTCGTSLWFDYLVEKQYISSKNYIDLAIFVDNIREWDTFEWIFSRNETANELNMLITIRGKERFIARFIKNISLEWTYEERILIEEEKLRIRRYIETKRCEMKTYKTKSGFLVGVVYAEQHMSMVANRLCRYNDMVDFVLVLTVSTGRASMRTTKEGINLQEIAEKLGGGGRTKRAGFPINSILDIGLKLESI